MSDQEDWGFSDWCNLRQQPAMHPAPQNELPAVPPVAQQVPVPVLQQPVIQNEQPARRLRRNRNSPERYGVHVYNEDQQLPGENDVTRPWCPGYTRDQY